MSYADQSTAGERVEAEIASLRAQLEKAENERAEARETAECYAIENETQVSLRVLKERDELRALVALADNWLNAYDYGKTVKVFLDEYRAREAYRAARKGGK